MTRIALKAAIESFPTRGTFRISRGARHSVQLIVCELRLGEHQGWGEGVPYARYGENPDAVLRQLSACAPDLPSSPDPALIQHLLPAGAARNALDSAMWDLQAKVSGIPVWQRLELPEPAPRATAMTLSLDTPDNMRRAARRVAEYSCLKMKCGGDDLDRLRVRAVREERPDARIIIDANEAWLSENLEADLLEMHKWGVELVEQPLPAGQDNILKDIRSPVPLCADESVHQARDLAELKACYDMINIKLDKTGGLTAALDLCKQAEAEGFRIMVGCMASTSLSIAPALMLSKFADILDLDGPLLMHDDRIPAVPYQEGNICPAPAELWG